jgi:hypothetical protein
MRRKEISLVCIITIPVDVFLVNRSKFSFKNTTYPSTVSLKQNMEKQKYKQIPRIGKLGNG